MRRFLRWSGRLVLLAVIIGGAALVWRWDDLVRLYRVNTLFDEAKIVDNFSHMDTMFLTAPAPRAGAVSPFRSRPVPLPATFTFEGREVAMDDFISRHATTSLLVAREDEITFEDYYLGTGPEDRRISWSVAKSFLSALIGIALEEGKIRSLDDTVETYAPALKGSAYEGATIRDVLHMSSGVAFDEDYMDPDSDINRMGRALALGRSMDKFAASITKRAGPPGEAFRYVSIDTHVLSMVLRAATGETLPQYLSEKIWTRIGPETDAYYVTDGLGVAFALGGLNMRTRDFARFGRLMLDDGKWGDAQIVPQAWVALSTDPSAPPAAPGAEKPFGYGMQWWVPEGSQAEFMGWGVYGQFLYVNPALRVVIVKTSADRHFLENESEAGRETVAAFRAIAESVAAASP